MSNNGSQDSPLKSNLKLRMAPTTPVEQLIHRTEVEQRQIRQQREAELEDGLGGFRVGSVKYLNAVPLTRGLEDHVVYHTPAELARMLERDELDAALVSVVEVLFEDRFDVLDGIAVASLGEVFSVFLAHRLPLAEITEVFCDPASLTSVELLKVLLAERGLRPEFKPLTDYGHSHEHDAVLLIGNPAIEFRRSQGDASPFTIWDLGAAWYELTQLPFVYAVWALKRGPDLGPLKQQLKEAKAFGLDTLDFIISGRTEYDRDFRQDYLGWHIHYHLGSDERRGLSRFVELLRKHSERTIIDPKFVS